MNDVQTSAERPAVAEPLAGIKACAQPEQAQKSPRSLAGLFSWCRRWDSNPTLFNFRRQFVDIDLQPTDEEIQGFYVRAVLPAHAYLSGVLVEKMHLVYNQSFELHQGIVEAEAQESSSLKWELTQALQDLGKRDLDQLIKEVAAEIDVGNT